MTEPKSKSWKVMADYSCGLWDDRGYGTGPDDDEINAPEEFVRRFDAWIYAYDSTIEHGVPTIDSFNKTGRALAAELKVIVGPDIKVTYVYEKGDGEYSGPNEEEML